jgi:hypothetical protein
LMGDLLSEALADPETVEGARRPAEALGARPLVVETRMVALAAQAVALVVLVAPVVEPKPEERRAPEGKGPTQARRLPGC